MSAKERQGQFKRPYPQCLPHALAPVPGCHFGPADKLLLLSIAARRAQPRSSEAAKRKRFGERRGGCLNAFRLQLQSQTPKVIAPTVSPHRARWFRDPTPWGGWAARHTDRQTDGATDRGDRDDRVDQFQLLQRHETSLTLTLPFLAVIIAIGGVAAGATSLQPYLIDRASTTEKSEENKNWKRLFLNKMSWIPTL